MTRVKNKDDIKKCALTALLFVIVGSGKYFMGWEENGWYYDFIFINPSFSSWAEMILMLLFCVLITLYIFKGSSRLKSLLLLSIGVGTLALENAILCLLSIVGYIKIEAFSSILFPIFFQLIPCVLFLLVTIELLKNGAVRKPLIWISIVVAVALSALPIVAYINMNADKDYYWYTNKILIRLYGLLVVVWDLGNILAYISLLRILLKGRIPAIIPAVKNNTAGLSAEQHLRLLKDRFELGLINENNYQEEKEKIINSL